MKLATALLLVLLAPSCLAQGLSNAEVLAAMDDASAAEARWILDSNFFAIGGIGIDGHETRPGIAFERLLRTKDARVFETLIDSRNGAAVCYGIAGLAELDPARLPALLPRLILRREAVAAASGCISSETTAIYEFAKQVERHVIEVDQSIVEAAWKHLMQHFSACAATLGDGSAVDCIRTLLGRLPESGSPAFAYAQALAAGDECENSLRKLAAEQPDDLAGRLALQRLAAARRPWTKTKVLECVWARDLASPDAVLDLRITAEFWDRVADGRITPGDDGLSGFYVCPWQQLGDDDWKWLAACDDQQVSKVAARLQANRIVSWHISQDRPKDYEQYRQWFLCLLAAANGDSVSASRAGFQLKAELTTADTRLPLTEHWSNGRTIAEEIVERLSSTSPKAANALVGSALIAACSDDWEQHLNGVQLLDELLDREPEVAGDVAASSLFPDLAKRVWKECEEAPETDRWPLRLLTLRMLDATWTAVRNDFPDKDASFQRWMRELAKRLVGNPRAMAPQLAVYQLLDLIMDTEGRASDMVGAILSGSDEFLPDDEQPDKRPEGEREPTPEMIYKRMQDALAKLDG